MCAKLNKRFCILAWTLILLTPLALIAGVGCPGPPACVSALKSSIAESEDQIARYRRVIATLPRLQAELER
jgi:general secretion pathway protein M